MRKRLKPSQQRKHHQLNRQRRQIAMRYKQLNQRRRLSQWLMMSVAHTNEDT